MPTIPPTARRLRPFLLLLAALALPACGGGEDDAEVEVEAEPSDIDNPALLGYWAVVERNGEVAAASELVRYQFTAQGDFIRYEGGGMAQARYTFASEDQITIDGPEGTRFYEYEVRGDELTLREPGEGGESLRLTKQADVDLENVPPPASVPEEDSVPADSMGAPPDTTRR
jgi:hypothetical protein